VAGGPSPPTGAARRPLQPTERIWGALKAWLANNPTLAIQGRVRQVHAFFRQRTPRQLLAIAAPHSSPWLPEGYAQHFRQAALARRPDGHVGYRAAGTDLDGLARHPALPGSG
jgi:hypothetical protein